MIPASPELEQLYERAPWMRIAHLYRGTPELKGGSLHPDVRHFFDATTYPRMLVTRITPWCSAFACSCLERSGYKSPHSARARAFLGWGIGLAEPVFGSVLVFARGPGKLSGHVAFADHDPTLTAGLVSAFGGNQHNAVCPMRRSFGDVIGIRWPLAADLPVGAIQGRVGHAN